jgi:hypothetical protein
MKTTAFRASAKGSGVTSDTPQKAAKLFFDTFPTKRKCDIIEGATDGYFFTVTYGRSSAGEWPQSWKDVTKKTADNLPDCPIRANQ